MGEYALIDGKTYKMGTCEDLYYITLARMRMLRERGRLAQQGHETAPKDWDDGSYRFRFPFPDEDGKDLDGPEIDYKRSVVIPLTNDPGLCDFEHYELCHSCSAGGSWNVNVFNPCPQDPKIASFKTSPMSCRLVGIRAQKPVNGEVWTVIECPYCGAMVRLPWKDAERLVVAVRAYADSMSRPGKPDCRTAYFHTIADRIEAGYTASR